MIVEVWQRVMDLAKTGTSGQDTQDEWNGKANSAQRILQQALLDTAEINQKSTDALSWLKIPTGSLTTDSSGKIIMPAGYIQMDSMELIANSTRYPVTKLRTNEIGMTRTSPIRKPNVANNNVYFYFKSGSPYIMPEQAGIVIDALYYKIVPDASITLTPVSDDDSDMVVPTVGVDFGWPQSIFNLLVYTILEQLGVELKESMLFEYAQYGITRDMIKTSANA